MTRWTYQLTPTTVNFKNAKFAELIPDQTFDNWPDGTAFRVTQKVEPFTVKDNGNKANVGIDEYDDGKHLRTRLTDAQGNPQTYTFNIKLDNAFLFEGGTEGTWADYVPCGQQSGPSTYTAVGVCQQSFVGTNTLMGKKQGPWEKAP